ncbi:MAG TPA: DsbE family thiol:disulfide interchange protein [Phenylobacterium sp.]|jgi:cytochrome c biogenesis protein CcmG/thiol:disulfide interchange protein DsbE|uniref:DsbE family thiol:disulfide interchange protein n=1 Tax=Phenylobacterium sp. TaxID=1871053 RepID=UPI002D288810|nr:DsbE family thiol:disulfide interchange protein [Phenylobacterium sp.]HZZ70419.1 DsbE family thiol:disulfide interchange protein [Phenylobacterium sp.]
MKRLIAILPVAAFVLVLLGFMVGLRRDPAILPSMLIGKPLPAFNLPPLKASEPGLASADLTGEPMLLNVFASWCGPCREEQPTLLQMKSEGVKIVGLDWKEEAAAGARWLDENGDPYLRTGNDSTGRAGIDLGVSGVPETFVVDRRGRVRYRQVGAITPEVWVQTIAPLMAKLKAES